MSRERRSSQQIGLGSGCSVWTEFTIYLVAVILAIASGVAAYERIGPYGDGPFGSGFRRVIDPQSGLVTLVRDVASGYGRLRVVYDPNPGRMNRDGAVPTRLEIDANGDGIVDVWEYYDLAQHLLRRGFSLSQDGILDAWAYYEPDGDLSRIEVSSGRDGTVDRWEHYDGGTLVRVEEDTNRDGKPDTWQTYADGLVLETATDDDADGQPDRRYGAQVGLQAR